MKQSLKKKLAKKYLWFKPLFIASNWMFQGFFGMDLTEKLGRVITEIIVFVIMYLLFVIYTKLNIIATIFISWFITHTLLWFLYSTIWAHIICILKLKKNTPEKLIEYTANLGKRLNKRKCILGAAVFGSMSRGELHEYSDIDLRVIRKKGLKHAINSIIVMWYERLRAQWYGIPLEAYLGDDVTFFNSMRKDEIPVIISDREGKLKDICQQHIDISCVYTHKNRKK